MLKQTLGELAILGGLPLFDRPVTFCSPNVEERNRLQTRIGAALDRRWLTNNGPFVQEFESRVAEIAGVPHAIAMCNATIAMQVLLRALDLTGEVIVPSFTFVATAHSVEWEGLTPIFADVNPKTHNLDPAKVEALITDRTSAILGVHLWGRACEVEALGEIASRHNLKLIYDAAHAIGCSHLGRPLGSFGNAEVYSFHATKAAHAIEGGVVVTADAALADRLRSMRNFGFAGFDNVTGLGTNAKMHEFSAAAGLCSLEDLDRTSAANRTAQADYHAALSDLPGIGLVRYEEKEANNYHYVIAEIEPAECTLTRDELIQVLQAENIVARRYFFPGCHRMEPYRSRYPFWDQTLPVTNSLTHRLLVLPNSTSVKPTDITNICDVIRFALKNPSVIRASMRSERMAQAA